LYEGLARNWTRRSSRLVQLMLVDNNDRANERCVVGANSHSPFEPDPVPASGNSIDLLRARETTKARDWATFWSQVIETRGPAGSSAGSDCRLLSLVIVGGMRRIK
jgi:hypothetical protein